MPYVCPDSFLNAKLNQERINIEVDLDASYLYGETTFTEEELAVLERVMPKLLHRNWRIRYPGANIDGYVAGAAVIKREVEGHIAEAEVEQLMSSRMVLRMVVQL